MSAAQILWINLILKLVPAFDPAEPNVMKRKPRPAGQGLFTSFLVWRIVLVSAVFAVLVLLLLLYALSRGEDVVTARTMVVNLMVILEIFYLFNVRYLHMISFSWRDFFGTPPRNHPQRRGAQSGQPRSPRLSLAGFGFGGPQVIYGTSGHSASQ